MTDLIDSPHFVFRLARPSDLNAVGDVHRNSVESLCGSHYSLFQIESWFDERPPGMYVNAIRSSRIWLAEEHQTVLGFLEIRPGEIEKLFVRGEASGRGIGRRLLQVGITSLRQKFDGPISVLSLLNAQAFYEKHGFQKISDAAILRGKAQIPVHVVRMELPSR